MQPHAARRTQEPPPPVKMPTIEKEDFVVNTPPLTPATTGLYDAKFFDAISRGVHAARGGVSAETRGPGIDDRS